MRRRSFALCLLYAEEKHVSSTELKCQSVDLVSGALARQERAKSARDSFVSYFRLVGRTQSGEPIIWDPEIIRTAEAAERAFWAGKNFVDEQGRGSAKSMTGWHFHAWLVSKFPAITVGHFSTNDQYAEDRNERLQDVLRSARHIEVFGDEGRIYEAQSNRRQTTVRGNPRAKSNPNVEAKGVLGARVGPRYDRLWLDDVVDLRTSIAQPAMLQAVKDAFRITIQKMLVDWRKLGHGIGRTGVGLSWFSGTPYAENDLHDEIVTKARKNAKKVSGDEFAQVWENQRSIYRRMVFGGPEENFYSPIPNVISPEFLAEAYEDNIRAFEMSYMLKAIGVGEKPFTKVFYWLPGNFKPWPEVVGDLGYCPPPLPREQWDSSTRSWPRIMCVDPGFTESKASSFTGLCIGTLGSDNRIYVLYADQMKKQWDKARERVLWLAKAFRVDQLFIEGGAQQSALLSYFRDAGLRNIESVSTKGKGKQVRAVDVSGEVNSGRVLLPGRVAWTTGSGRKVYSLRPAKKAWYDKAAEKKRGEPYGDIQALANQILAYPGLEHNDLMDAFVYCVQKLRERSKPRGEYMAVPYESAQAAVTARRMQLARDACFGAKPKGSPATEWAVFAGTN